MRLALFAVVMLTSGPTWAASPRVVATNLGEDAPLGVYAVIRGDCSVGAAPDIRVTRTPAHGAIVLQEVQFAGKRAGPCTLMQVPARQVTYRPAAGFSGQDEVTFEIVNRTTGQVDSHTVMIIVQAAPNGI